MKSLFKNDRTMFWQSERPIYKPEGVTTNQHFNPIDLLKKQCMGQNFNPVLHFETEKTAK